MRTTADQKRAYIVHDWLVKPDLLTIARDGHEKVLEPRIMELLVYLCAHKGEVVSRDELMDRVWSSVVTENAVNRAVALLRKALEENKDQPVYITTVAKKGYRLIAPVQVIEDGSLQRESKAVERNGGAGGSEKTQASGKGMIGKRGMLVAGLFILSGLTAGLVYQLTKATLIPNKQPFTLGNAVPITALQGNEHDPSFSPDGTRLAFSHRAPATGHWDIYIQATNGSTAHQLTDSSGNDRAPAWSPDGNTIAFHRFKDGQCEIRKYDLQLQSETRIAACHPSSFSSDVSWSKQENVIYFTDGDSSVGQYRIFSYSLDTGKKQQLSNPLKSGRGDYRIALSPTARSLALIRNEQWNNSQILTLDLETNQFQALHQVSHVLFDIAWDSSGEYVIFVGDDNQINAISVQDRSIIQIAGSAQHLYSPTISPTGDMLAVVSGSERYSDIWMSEIPDFAGGSLVIQPFIQSSRIDKIARANHQGEVAFMSDRSGLNQIWVRRDDGRDIQLSDFQKQININHLDWSSDGRWLLYTINGQIHTLDSTTRQQHQIPLDHKFTLNPTWSVDGAYIFFATEVDGDWQIWRWSRSTQMAERITRSGGFMARQNRVGEDVYFSKYRQTGIWHLDISSSKETRLIDDFNPENNYYDWFITPKYIIYSKSGEIGQPGGTGIQIVRFDLENGDVELLYETSQSYWFDFSVSPSGNAILVTKAFRSESEIIAFPIIKRKR